ncbi:hypothetical protein RQP46_011326 [Phenoliferia psychrophenolica]
MNPTYRESYTDDDSDAGDLSDASRGVARARGSSARGASATDAVSASGSAFKGKGPMGAPALLRSSSAHPRSKSRTRSSREIDDDELDSDLARPPMSPVIGRQLDGDDEVERRDRGEELVRQRMRDRAKLKKEAEKAAKKRDSDVRDARASRLQDGRRASYAPPPPSDFDPTDAPLDRSFSGPVGDRPTSAAFPRSRDTSRSGLHESVSSEGTELGGYANNTVRGTVPPSPVSVATDAWPVSTSQMSPAFARRPSYASSTASESANVFSDRPLSGRPLSSLGEPTASTHSRDGEAEDEDDNQEEDEDASDDGAVEYTLKDRQDAINIEHPFGLPIWKPALYKKSRSVTRNAETALHATPSSTALRHLAPGNLLWTLTFGLVLVLVCAIVGAVLVCVPWGGDKYARVIWELGGYLFWPFGKYVEGWSDGDEGDELSETEDYPAIDEEDEDEDYDGAPASSSSSSPPPPPHDLEQAGRTFSRGRSVASRPSSRVDQLFAESGDATAGSLPDEPRRPSDDRTPLLPTSSRPGYGAGEDKRSSSEDTIAATRRPHDFTKDRDGPHAFRVRALGRSMYWVGFYLVVAPVMLAACILCWAMVFTIPMAKLLWVLLRHLNNEPLSLHFRSPPKYATPPPTDASDTTEVANEVPYPLRAGQRAPPVSRQSVRDAKAHGRLFGPRSTVLLCTYRAAGLQYYKYTIDGVNILFINLLSLVFFTIADFIWIAPWVDKHGVGGVLGALAGHGAIFTLALLSVIPLSYFIGMAVASISAQSSIGMGAVINASFGSIIEIILYCIALTQSKADLVEGSIVGSLLAGVLLMPGLSMIGGAMRRKEQRFNAKSAGVTSTMLIMAIIGILTPTLFYEIYGSFQLTCTGCDPDPSGTTTSCRTCYYEHVDPVDDPFYKTSVRLLSFWCAGILVLSYLIGLWFSLRTHASQIWQNAQTSHEQAPPRPLTTTQIPQDRSSLYKRVLPSHLVGAKQNRDSVVGGLPVAYSPSLAAPRTAKSDAAVPGLELPHGLTAEEFSRAFEVVNATAEAMRSQPHPAIHRQPSHVREVSKAEEEDGQGGHDAPNWSRSKSASVLMGCTVLYAIIAEILVDMVDVVLDGSGIPEKFLGVTLFALVPNTTEFMNAISFAINGNIALSLEIGSAYALQVCLIQAPVMLAFSAFYGIGKESLIHQAFTLVFPRWDVIAIIFSVFLLTYTYLEARANYYKGSILCLSYLVLIGGFAFAPAGNPTVTNPGSFGLVDSPSLSGMEHVQALWLTLFTN